MPLFSDLLQSLSFKREQTQAEFEAKYKDLVSRCATDTNVAERTVESTLTETGHTLAELERDVAIEQERLENVSILQGRGALLSESSELTAAEQATEAKHRAAIKQANEEYAASMREIQERQRRVNAGLERCSRAESALLADNARLQEIAVELRDVATEERRVAHMFRSGATPRRVRNSSTAAGAQQRIDEKRAALLAERDALRESLVTTD